MSDKQKFSFFAALVVLFMTGVVLSPAAMAATQLKVLNNFSTPVDVWWNSTDPFPSNITVTSQDGVRKEVRIPVDQGKGTFTLSPGHTAIIRRTSGGDKLSGSVTFSALPVCQCGEEGMPPCPQFGPGFDLPKKLPNGVNQGEFTLNPPGNFESVDISCVNGANTRMEMRLEGGSPVWNNNITHQPVSTIMSERVDISARLDKNCDNVGVFPFVADDCTNTVKQTCPTGPFCHHAVHDCQLNRTGSGGVVTIVLNGFTMP